MTSVLDQLKQDRARLAPLADAIPAVAKIVARLDQATKLLVFVYGEDPEGVAAMNDLSTAMLSNQPATAEGIHAEPISGPEAMRVLAANHPGLEFTTPEMINLLATVGWTSSSKTPMETVRTVILRASEPGVGLVEKVDAGRYRFVRRSPIVEVADS